MHRAPENANLIIYGGLVFRAGFYIIHFGNGFVSIFANIQSFVFIALSPYCDDALHYEDLMRFNELEPIKTP